MVGFLEEDKKLFPINEISSIVQLFQNQLEHTAEPDLILLSIIVGFIENDLTCTQPCAADDASTSEEKKLPVLEFDKINELYTRFTSLIKGAVDLSTYNKKYATRELVKRVSDVVWNTLSRSYYKDRAHLQSIYSYLSCSKLDCFGFAFSVVAACQTLGFNDVHLAITEDHAWVVFGEHGEQTSEITWHGKGNEDKRGQTVDAGIATRSWLYLNGNAVICNRAMEVAAIVSSINPSFSATDDAVEVAEMQQELLWLLHDLGHLKRYPIALGNLGELEEAAPTQGKPPAINLFQEAVRSARKYYLNAHIYPYTYLGGYLYRHGLYSHALSSWADAADVLRTYDYHREDTEIYKEFLEIANELIPHTVRVDDQILRLPRCFGYLLRFYDGICQWEEGAVTPVLHIGWAKPLVNTISKFDASVRAQVVINCYEEDKGLDASSDEGSHNNNNYFKNKEKYDPTKELIKSLELKVPESPEPLHPCIQALIAACGEKILNRDFLLQGDGDPFVTPGDTAFDFPMSSSSICGGLSTPSTSQDSTSLDDGISEMDIEIDSDESESPPRITLYSHKMKGLKDLLLAEKLNTHAISLQLTAQSQVQVGRKTRGSDDSSSGPGRPKRTRRE